MTEDNTNSTDKNFCRCGCGTEISFRSKHRGEPRRYVHGHNCYTKERNHLWRGDNVGYDGLHRWIRRHLSRPDLCKRCKLVSPIEVANITGIYSRDFENWEWMCTKCHRIFDLRIDMTNRKCFRCGNSKTLIPKNTGRPHWLYLDKQLVCRNCYQRERRRLFGHV